MNKTILATAVALAVSTGSAQAISIVNSGFEDPAGTGTLSFFSTGPFLPGWTITAGNVETVDAWTASEGLRSLDLNGVNAGAIQQTLSGFQVGALYELLFDMGGNYFGGNTSQTASASIGSASQQFTHTPETGDTARNFTWKEMSLQFEALATSQTLSFTQVSAGSAAGAALDNIRINLIAPVPIPAGLPLLLAGLGTFAWMRRRAA